MQHGIGSSAGRLLGAMTRKAQRLAEVDECIRTGIDTVGSLTRRELLLIAAALYWGEGSKQSARYPSTALQICNSDPSLLKVFINWLQQEGVSESRLHFELYVHESRLEEVEVFKEWWALALDLPVLHTASVIVKKGNPATKRATVGDLYHGLVRIKVKRSTHMNRQVQGYIAGIRAAVGSGVTGNTSAFGAEDSRFDP